jgi:hypothetical protein
MGHSGAFGFRQKWSVDSGQWTVTGKTAARSLALGGLSSCQHFDRNHSLEKDFDENGN